MNLKIVQISNAEKIRNVADMDKRRVFRQELLLKEQFAYQLAIYCENACSLKVTVNTPLKNQVKLYVHKNSVMDYPGKVAWDDDYITNEPGLMPDLLVPLEEQNNIVQTNGTVATVWVEVVLSEDCAPGTYPITVAFSNEGLFEYGERISVSETMQIVALPNALKEQETIFTQWFHTDCIARVHNVPIYSEEHWCLIDRYMKLAVELGINMILTPIITPPLDVNPGVRRPCTQLVEITKEGKNYSFNFDLLKRWIDLCKKNGIMYYEMAHLFSQWGLFYSPNIQVTENGVTEYKFGWDVPAQDESYREFLTQFLPALIEFLKSEEIKEQTYFHLSDEPWAEHLENYRYAHDLVKPLIDGCIIMDAMSDIDFYQSGLVSCPVTATDCIEPFLRENIENQWAYYCCSQGAYVGNRFFSMPSYRNRILGLQIYKHGVKGFLHWGYNFYYSQRSLYEINPYVTSSADMSFPSGDSFTVYPSKDGAYASSRGKIFKEALQDIEICRMLEQKIGKEKVVELIEKEAGMEVTFSYYPRNTEFIPRLMNKMRAMLK